MGYHRANIPKGTYGEFSKIIEEYAELMDAIDQESKILILVELADLLGATIAYFKADPLQILLTMGTKRPPLRMSKLSLEKLTLLEVIDFIKNVLDEYAEGFNILDVYTFTLATESAFKEGLR